MNAIPASVFAGFALLILLAGCRDGTGVEEISHEYELELQADRDIETMWETRTIGRHRDGSVTATLFEDGHPVESATGTGPGYLTGVKAGATLDESRSEPFAADNVGAVSSGCETGPPPRT